MKEKPNLDFSFFDNWKNKSERNLFCGSQSRHIVSLSFHFNWGAYNKNYQITYPKDLNEAFHQVFEWGLLI